jgi:hypothetical protein
MKRLMLPPAVVANLGVDIFYALPFEKQEEWRKRFTAKKCGSFCRDIGFNMSLAEFVYLWRDHLDEIGNRKGKYVLARYRDQGPYALGNCRVITFERNTSEMHITKPYLVERMREGRKRAKAAGIKMGRKPRSTVCRL